MLLVVFLVQRQGIFIVFSNYDVTVKKKKKRQIAHEGAL